jgi:hypothetical protein
VVGADSTRHSEVVGATIGFDHVDVYFNGEVPLTAAVRITFTFGRSAMP